MRAISKPNYLLTIKGHNELTDPTDIRRRVPVLDLRERGCSLGGLRTISGRSFALGAGTP